MKHDNRPEKIEIDLSGSKLTMLMPPHSNYEGFAGKEPALGGVTPCPASANRDTALPHHLT